MHSSPQHLCLSIYASPSDVVQLGVDAWMHMLEIHIDNDAAASIH
jgi:hypothetical protein